ncbi:hypothetical protein ACFOZY_00210 [Chungangia koreensis]|uniref:Uncharacterized protein n=1 Tax=Chungangia koreensis TaxID=752657 RepID=A0ABV8WZZ9_9LACT
MKVARIIVVMFALLFLLVWSYKYQEQPTEETLFTVDQITHTNIEQLQVHQIALNETRVIEDPVAIKMFATKFKELNNINESSVDVGKPIYLIYVVNNGRYPHTPISVYRDSLEFHGKRRDMNSEESSSFFKILEEIQKNSKEQGS